MKNGRSFPFPGLNSRRNSVDPAVTDLIELLPLGAVLIDSRSTRIEAANARFLELFCSTASDLIGCKVDDILPEWESGSAMICPDALQPIGHNTKSGRSKGDAVAARITTVPALPKGKRVLLVELPDSAATSALSEFMAHLWGGLRQFLNCLQESDLSASLESALQVIRELLGADEAAMYRIESDQPVLRSCLPLKDGSILPDEITPQEMATLNRARLWEFGKRPVGDLQRRARSAQLTYLVSAPVGHEQATIGLLVAGSAKPALGIPILIDGARINDILLPAIQTLAAGFTLIFNQHAWRENLERERMDHQRRLRLEEALADHSAEGLVVLDSSLNISRLNASAEQMFGYAGSEVIGQVVEKILIGPEALQPALDAARQGSPTYSLGDVRLYRRSGDAFLALVRIFPVLTNGIVESILILIQDLSEQEQIRMQSQLLEQRALLGEVTAIFAHEVRNPVNNISTTLQFMSMNLDQDDPNQPAITRMLQDCERLSELLKSVLAFSKPAEYLMEPLDLVELLRRLLDRLHPRIVHQNVHYDLRADDTCPKVNGNFRALEQVFSNLITNAIQAMSDQGGHLILKVSQVREDGQIYTEVSVADTGPGIPKEVLERIFQPFYTTKTGGTGLGLAIVKRIITDHKGMITVTSFPGGTIFRVRLPAL